MNHHIRQQRILRYINWRTWRCSEPPTLSEVAAAFGANRESLRQTIARIRRDFDVELTPEPITLRTFPKLEDRAPHETYVNFVHEQGELIVA